MARERPRTGTVYDEGEWIDAGGLATWVVRAGPRDGTPVVLVHGIPTSAYLYRDVMRAMYEERDCIAFDWPGFGSSQKGRQAPVDHDGRARHLAALLDAMGLAKIDLVVHDVGGPAGLLFAVRHPGRVRKLVILNTTVYKRDYHPPAPAVAQFIPGVHKVSRPFFTRALFDLFMKRGLARPERVRREVMDNHWRLAKRDGGIQHVLATWAAIPHGGEAITEIRTGMEKFEPEVLVLFGADDPFLPPPNAERFAKAFPHASLQLLPNVGHFLQEDAPEIVAERISGFLSAPP